MDYGTHHMADKYSAISTVVSYIAQMSLGEIVVYILIINIIAYSVKKKVKR